jgi:hypothetical protein
MGQLHDLEAYYLPDLFHVQRDLVKAVSGPMGTKERAAQKAGSSEGAVREVAKPSKKYGTGACKARPSSAPQGIREPATSQASARCGHSGVRASRSATCQCQTEHPWHWPRLPLCRSRAWGAPKLKPMAHYSTLKFRDSGIQEERSGCQDQLGYSCTKSPKK